MAARTISQTDTLETFRTTFNALSEQDFGDIANLSSAITSTNLVDAMNETIGIATSTAGWTITDSSATSQIVAGGDTLTVNGTSNQIIAVVSSPDTLTIGLPNDVTVTGEFTAQGTGTHSLGTIQVTGNTINSSTADTITIDDKVAITNSGNTITIGGTDGTYIESSDGHVRFGTSNIVTSGFIYTRNSNGFVLEGSTEDDFETRIVSVDATADRIITLPDEDGTVVTTGGIGVITSTMILNGTISTDDIADDQISEAKIADDAVGQDQLKSVVNLQILNSSGGILKTLYAAGA